MSAWGAEESATSISVSGSGEVQPDSNISIHCDLPASFPPGLGIPDVINKIQAAIAIITALVGLPMTLYLLVIIIKFKLHNNRPFFLYLQILVVQIAYYLVIPLTILISGIVGHWVFGEGICNVNSVIHDTYAMFRFSMMFALTFDRFLYIFLPFSYSKYGGKVIWLILCLIWVLSLIRVILPLHGIMNCFAYIPSFKTCTLSSQCSEECKYFGAASITFIVSAGVVLPLIMYIGIFIKARRIMKRKNTNQDSVSTSGDPQRNKFLITVFSLLISIIFGTFPAFSLYIVTLFYPKPVAGILITNMLIGRTFFNLIPIFDAFAFSRYQEIKKISANLIKSFMSHFKRLRE